MTEETKQMAKRSKGQRAGWWLPLACAAPILAAMAFVWIRFGGQAQELLNAAVKLAVIP